MKKSVFLFSLLFILLSGQVVQTDKIKVKYFYDDYSFYLYYKNIMECSRFMLNSYKNKDSVYYANTLRYFLGDTSEVILPECIITFGEVLLELKELNIDLYKKVFRYVILHATLREFCSTYRCFKTGILDIE